MGAHKIYQKWIEKIQSLQKHKLINQNVTTLASKTLELLYEIREVMTFYLKEQLYLFLNCTEIENIVSTNENVNIQSTQSYTNVTRISL